MVKNTLNEQKIFSVDSDTDLQTEDNVSHAKQIEGESFIEIDVNKIKNNPMQPRLHIDEAELDDLMKGIKLHGLIQPISVVKSGESEYILKAGQRRWMAHKKLGLKTIKAIVQEELMLPEKELEKSLFEIAVMENTHRENLSPLELALSLKTALDRKIYKNQEELSIALSKNKSYVSKALKVLSLDKEITNDLEENRSTNDIEALYEIQKIKDEKEQVRIYFDFIKKTIDRKGIREYNRVKNKDSNTRSLYKFASRAKKVKLEVDVSSFTDEQINDMRSDIEEVLKKYC